ncbi:MAG: type II toxin-antitoxin system VapC family toxin [Thermoproteota archaeon]
MIYLDSNVFIYAALNADGLGSKMRQLLARVEEGSEAAASSVLTFDELVWAVGKRRKKEDSWAAGQAFLGLRNLKLIDVSPTVLASALEIMRKYNLAPRDGIHAASAITRDIKTIVSSDGHFDKIEGLRRRFP